ncbi:uncharacterized protein AB675_3166 [Cyphellophora attinorum]|uniref:Xylanolytic transcriptional activator regulatory domain-containing protein n=1 Tax=Cyphellophora attinorum TaxID=1664694 RepID=A0A0N0NKD5_9EURO|nr:uncharacterized protein AB675_3166 [Phialophora attinorum]KPI37908.1 hypothetical protein AB675_3166 [Phialophora attinorum]
MSKSSCEIACLVEDPVTKRQHPRDYVSTLENRIAQLELALVQGSYVSPTSGTDRDETPANEESRPQRENNSTFAESLATLGLNASGNEKRYLGQSSVVSFSRIISSSLLKAAPTKIHDVGSTSTDLDVHQFPCLLPDLNSARLLSDAYFRSIQQQYPFLHEPTFRAWESDLFVPGKELVDSDRIPLFFLYAVYATAAILLPNSSYDSKASYPALYRSRASLGQSRVDPGLALLRSVLLAGGRGTFDLETVWTCAKAVCRSWMQRRAFWTAFTIDCSQSTTLGRPLGVPVHEVNAEYPLDLDDEHIIDTGVLRPPRASHQDPPTSMSVAIHVFKSRFLWARIHTELLSDMAAEFSGRDERILRMRAELEEWMATRPPVPAHSVKALVLFGCEDWFTTNYAFSILLLYRTQLTEPHPSDQSF